MAPGVAAIVSELRRVWEAGAALPGRHLGTPGDRQTGGRGPLYRKIGVGRNRGPIGVHTIRRPHLAKPASDVTGAHRHVRRQLVLGSDAQFVRDDVPQPAVHRCRRLDGGGVGRVVVRAGRGRESPLERDLVAGHEPVAIGVGPPIGEAGLTGRLQWRRGVVAGGAVARRAGPDDRPSLDANIPGNGGGGRNVREGDSRVRPGKPDGRQHVGENGVGGNGGFESRVVLTVHADPAVDRHAAEVKRVVEKRRPAAFGVAGRSDP